MIPAKVARHPNPISVPSMESRNRTPKNAANMIMPSTTLVCSVFTLVARQNAVPDVHNLLSLLQDAPF